MKTRAIASTATIGMALLFAVASSGCQSNVQARPVHPAQAAVGSGSAMPAPKAPFDETPITPMETVGASRTN
ncbi:MAG: hypothetical protein HY021_06245 [Burkholderiales bacterium]|nr:hypothetical protein [Burkholderiales bacterium]